MDAKKRGFKSSLLFPIVLIVFLAVYFLGPFRLCSVVSGSMEPNLPTWSLCVINVKVPYEEIEVGDIVVYNRMSDGKRIIHRVKEITDEGMITKGDANKTDDGVSVTKTAENLFGKYLFHVPKLGKLSKILRSPAGIAVVCVLIVVLLFLPDGKKKTGKDGQEQEQAPQEPQQPQDSEDSEDT